MSLIYITGPSGVGKSTVRNELIKRGYEAHDTDEDGFSAWYDNQTLESVERPDPENRPDDWYEKHDYRLSAEKVKELAKRAKAQLIFLCGIPANDKEFKDYYSKIICLVIDEETMTKRVTSRTTNTFGSSPDELKLMLHWHGKMLERYKEWGATMVDATQPLDKVVDEILKTIG
jgi:dephospho-CoA kinase